MKRIVEAIKKDLESKNYYSATYVSLSLVDACAKIEYPVITNNKARYIEWLKNFFIPLHERDKDNPMLPSKDIYHFRCSILHESSTSINLNKQSDYNKKNIQNFILTTTSSHRNVAISGKFKEIQINIHKFIEEILESIEVWMSKKKEEEYKLDFTIEEKKWSSSDSKQFYNCS